MNRKLANPGRRRFITSVYPTGSKRVEVEQYRHDGRLMDYLGPPKPSRRQFLKISGTATAVGIAKYLGFDILSTIKSYFGKRDDKKPGAEVTLTLNSGDPVPPLEQIAETAESSQPIEGYKNYFAVSANENPLYANFNLKLLLLNGYGAFLERDETSNVYRTVVGTNLSKEDLQKRLAALNRFDVRDIWERRYDNGQIKGLEEKTKEIDLKSNQHLADLSKIQYIEEMAPLVAKAQRYNNGAEHSRLTPQEVLGIIYDSAREFSVPLRPFTTIIYVESSFRNVKGDLDLGKNYSEGIGQMRKLTQKDVFKWMKKAGVLNLSRKLPKSILPYPELQGRMSAFYYRKCFEIAKGDERRAAALYNAGINSNSPNIKYTAKFAERYNDITRTMNPQ